MYILVGIEDDTEAFLCTFDGDDESHTTTDDKSLADSVCYHLAKEYPKITYKVVEI